MEELTKAEEQIMQALWKLEKAFVKDLIAALPAPKPKSSTVTTMLGILERKGFVSHEKVGRSHRYYPLVAKEKYSDAFLKSVMSRYFGGSFRNMVSFFVKRNDVDLAEFEELVKHLEAEERSEKDPSQDKDQDAK